MRKRLQIQRILLIFQHSKFIQKRAQRSLNVVVINSDSDSCRPKCQPDSLTTWLNSGPPSTEPTANCHHWNGFASLAYPTPSVTWPQPLTLPRKLRPVKRMRIPERRVLASSGDHSSGFRFPRPSFHPCRSCCQGEGRDFKAHVAARNSNRVMQQHL